MKLLRADPNELVTKLRNYLADPNYKIVFDYTKQQFQAATELTAHNWDHVYRDIITAIVIGEAEKADMNIVLPAITMHDIGFLYGADGKTHGAVGADRLKEYLEQAGAHYPPEQLEHVANCIRTHKGSMHNESPASLEAKVVADADLLDKFGPFGVYQKIRVYTEFNRSLADVLAPENDATTLTLQTTTGQKLADPGRQFVYDFFQELAEANEPYAPEV